MTRVRTISTFLLFIALGASTLAHDTWLSPDRFVVPQETLVMLDLTSGMAFPALETPIKPERVERAFCRLLGHMASLESSASSKSLRFKSQLKGPGIATLWAELKPRSLELTASQVQEYLDEIDAGAAIRQQWATAKRPRRWREVYTKHSKTFVRVGEPERDRSWAEPVGMFLEIVPEHDPTALDADDTFPVRVLKDGAPLVGFSLGILRQGGRQAKTVKTDAQGRVTFQLGRDGRYLLRGTELRRSSQAGFDWESNFTTLTIQVSPK